MGRALGYAIGAALCLALVFTPAAQAEEAKEEELSQEMLWVRYPTAKCETSK